MEQMLYRRCPSCEGAAAYSGDCKQCDGVGFVPAGLTLEMLDRLHRQVQELARQSGSLGRVIRALRDDRRMSERPRRDGN